MLARGDQYLHTLNAVFTLLLLTGTSYCFSIITQYFFRSSWFSVLSVLAVVQIFEVTSTTTIKDLRCSIASQLRLTSADGYGLYLKTPNKVRLVGISAGIYCLWVQFSILFILMWLYLYIDLSQTFETARSQCFYLFIITKKIKDIFCYIKKPSVWCWREMFCLNC